MRGPQWAATGVSRRKLNGRGDVAEWSSCGRPGWPSRWRVRSCRRRGALAPCAEWSWLARQCPRRAPGRPIPWGVWSLVVLCVLPVPPSHTSASPATFAPRMSRLCVAGCRVPLGSDHGPGACTASIVGVPVYPVGFRFVLGLQPSLVCFRAVTFVPRCIRRCLVQASSPSGPHPQLPWWVCRLQCARRAGLFCPGG